MMNYGILLDICAGLGTRCTEITSAVWKKAVMSGMGRDKGSAILQAGELYPTLTFGRKKDHHRAEAALLGWYSLHTITYTSVSTLV
jgi:hypothetical protein